MTKFQRFSLLWAIFNLVFLLTGCTSDWTSQANNIIIMLVPAVNAALGILLAFSGISPDIMKQINVWSTAITDDLTNVVKPLIDEYNAATADTKPTILEEINAALGAVKTNFANILNASHVTNPNTQAKIQAVLGAVMAEITALVNLMPVLQGKVTNHNEAKTAIHAVKSADDFKKHFNEAASAFGPQYTI